MLVNGHRFQLQFQGLLHVMDEIGEEVEGDRSMTVHYLHGERNYVREPMLFLRPKGFMGWWDARMELRQLGIPRSSPLIVVPKMNSSHEKRLPVLVGINSAAYEGETHRCFDELARGDKSYDFEYVKSLTRAQLYTRVFNL